MKFMPIIAGIGLHNLGAFIRISTLGERMDKQQRTLAVSPCGMLRLITAALRSSDAAPLLPKVDKQGFGSMHANTFRALA